MLKYVTTMIGYLMLVSTTALAQATPTTTADLPWVWIIVEIIVVGGVIWWYMNSEPRTAHLTFCRPLRKWGAARAGPKLEAPPGLYGRSRIVVLSKKLRIPRKLRSRPSCKRVSLQRVQLSPFLRGRDFPVRSLTTLRDASRITSGRSAASSSHLSQYSSAARRASIQEDRCPAPLRQPLGRFSAVMVQSHCSFSDASFATVATRSSPLSPSQLPSCCRSHRIISSLASADFHNEAGQKDAVKRSRLANHSGFLRAGRMKTVSRALSKLGNDVVARMAQEVVRGAGVVRLQFLASEFYEAVKAELDQPPRHEASRVGALVLVAPNHPFPVENASQAERELAIGEDIRWRRKRLVAHFAFPAFVTFSFTPGSSPLVNWGGPSTFNNPARVAQAYRCGLWWCWR